MFHDLSFYNIFIAFLLQAYFARYPDVIQTRRVNRVDFCDQLDTPASDSGFVNWLPEII
jgi:hypothetical protein